VENLWTDVDEQAYLLKTTGVLPGDNKLVDNHELPLALEAQRPYIASLRSARSEHYYPLNLAAPTWRFAFTCICRICGRNINALVLRKES